MRSRPGVEFGVVQTSGYVPCDSMSFLTVKVRKCFSHDGFEPFVGEQRANKFRTWYATCIFGAGKRIVIFKLIGPADYAITEPCVGCCRRGMCPRHVSRGLRKRGRLTWGS